MAKAEQRADDLISRKASMPERNTETQVSMPEYIARSIASRLFLPVDADYTRAFSLPIRLLILVALASLVALSCPPLIDIISQSNIQPFASIRSSTAVWNDWLPFAITALEVILAIAVGGSVFGEWAARQSQDVVQRLQSSFEKSSSDGLGTTEANLVNEILSYRDIFKGLTWLNLIPRMYQAYMHSKQVLRMSLQTVPRANARFLAAKLSVAFPGGLFGLLSFVLFILIVAAKVLALYASIEYPPQ